MSVLAQASIHDFLNSTSTVLGRLPYAYEREGHFSFLPSTTPSKGVKVRFRRFYGEIVPSKEIETFFFFSYASITRIRGILFDTTSTFPET